MLADAITPRYRALVILAVDSGMRWSELVGLRRSKLDLNRKVRVTEQLVRLDDGTFDRKEPKTAADTHSITISTFTTSVLRDHVDHRDDGSRDGLVFTNTAGRPLASPSFLTHHFGPARRSAGLTCRFHDLRHTSVALAIASGAHPKAIQARMGHSSINVTLDRYGHLFPGTRHRDRRLLRPLLGAGRGTAVTCRRSRRLRSEWRRVSVGPSRPRMMLVVSPQAGTSGAPVRRSATLDSCGTWTAGGSSWGGAWAASSLRRSVHRGMSNEW